VDGPAAWLLRAATLLGLWLTLRSAAMIDIWELAGVRQAGGVPGQLPDRTQHVAEFRAVGPYSWVRHPIYLGWFLIVFSATTMTVTRLVFAVVSSAYVLVAIPLEEATLRKTTVGAYERYAKLVRWKLLPRVY
jgi:protein-S-isoprenylcysteine O-methyltransferase Ste14